MEGGGGKIKKPQQADFFVRGRGLEPPRITPLVPKTNAATNYATHACEAEYSMKLADGEYRWTKNKRAPGEALFCFLSTL